MSPATISPQAPAENLCPCGNKSFATCCKPFLSHERPAPNPEALMRSRYSAYTQANMDYIEQTMKGQARTGFDPVKTAAWAKSIEWLGLTVIQSQQLSPHKGSVEFIARFKENNRIRCIYEVSDFDLIDDKWYYISGITPKISRNQNCPCGSGKKAKRCCFP